MTFLSDGLIDHVYSTNLNDTPDEALFPELLPRARDEVLLHLDDAQGGREAVGRPLPAQSATGKIHPQTSYTFTPSSILSSLFARLLKQNTKDGGNFKCGFERNRARGEW